MRSLSTKLVLLIAIPVAVLVALSVYLTISGAQKVIRLQAEQMASTVAKQVITDRKHYVNEVVAKLKGTPYAAREGYTDQSAHVPLPATFVINVANEVSSSQSQYRYGLVSEWNINPGNSLSDDFLKRGFADLTEQEVAAKAAGKLSAEAAFDGWQPYSEVLDVNGGKVLRYLSADVASGQACVACHNGLEQRDDIMALRNEAGISAGRSFELNDLMGAVAVEVSLDQAGAVAMSNARSSLSWLLGAGAIAIGIAVLTVRRAVTGPIKAITEKFSVLATGGASLSYRFDEKRSDELGRLSASMNTFLGFLNNILSQAGQSSEEVATAATELAANAEQVATGMRDQTAEVHQASSAIQEMSSSIVEVAQRSGEAARNAADSGKIAEEGGEIVKQTIERMQSISEVVAAGAVSVTGLGKRSEQIGKIIAVIDDIADQTNLLALNAAIEAARAGEHGRGFAVVADEVRKLADRTTKATAEIANSIREIQADTAGAVERMDVGTEQVRIGVEHATQAGLSLENMVARAKEVAELVRSIAAAAEEQSAASEEVSRNIERISSVTLSTAQSSDQVASATAGLSRSAEGLRSVVSRFKLDDREKPRPDPEA